MMKESARSKTMYVKLNRDVCGHEIATCERCFGRFLLYPMGYERQCFEEIVDDGSDLLTIDIHSGDKDYHLVLDEKERKLLAAEGWAKVLELAHIL
jgi:hypothetical protein